MVDQQQFCLRWNNHGSTLVAVFDNLLASESLVDVTLFAEGHLLKAHKVVLSACSPYFQTLFAQTTDKHPIVILKDVKHVELKALLDYMYRGEVNVSQDQLGPLIKTAESLKIKGLADGTNKREVDSRVSHPAGPIIPKTENSLVGAKCGRPGLDSNFPAPSVTVPSVLSTVLTMPPALSLASSNLVPSIKLPNLATTTVVDSSPQEDNDTPQAKRRKKMRRKSGDVSCGGGDSGDSDSRSSGSPRDGIHLPRIPATITPIPPLHQSHLQDQLQQQHKEREKDFERELEREREREQQERERERERDREQELERERERERDREREQESMREVQEQLRSSSPPENLVGSSSRGDCVIDIPRSSPGGITRPFSDIDYGCDSMNKSLGQHSRPDENSSDANHQSDDEYEERGIMSRIYQDHPDTPGPSTSRLPPEDSPHPPGYLGWPYPPDTPGSEESFSALENPNQDYLRAYNLVRAGFPGLLPPRMSADILARPPPIGLPLLLKGREKGSPKSLLGGYPYSESPKQFACEKCGRSYASTGNLKRHKKYECGVEPQFSCPICKKKFQHRHSVKIHVFSTHRNEAGEGMPDPSKDAPLLYPKSEGMAAVGPVQCKEEFFPIPQEANAPTTHNQDG